MSRTHNLCGPVYLVGLVCGAEGEKSATGATLGYKSAMQSLDDWLMAQQYENLIA